MPPSVSVIICAYTEERWQQLIEAIKSVQQQTMPACELLIVIDHNPHLFERLGAWDDGIRVLENREAKGLSGARNTGVAAATGDSVAFLDDDAIAAPDWLATMIRHCGEQVLGVGAAVMPVWEKPKPAWFPEEFYWTVGCSYLGMPVAPASIRNPLGGAMCISRHVFAEIGDFHGALGHLGSHPMGCEETELCIRARKRWPGSSFIYEPAARIYHHIPEKRARFSYFSSRCYSEGLSKALVVRLVGGSAGLSSERAYTFVTLPRGILHGMADAIHGELAGVARAGAILLGLGLTTLGFIVGTLSGIGRRDESQTAAASVGPSAR
jgi:glucosyl-dolichyl phosphate glucuronosyltransferase